MDVPDNRLALNLHPIQLQEIGVRELYIRVRNPVKEVSSSDVKLEIGHAPLAEDNTLRVRIRALIGMDENDETPCTLRVELVAKFLVNTTEFPVAHLDHWARHNAMFVLYPYLREHLYSLTSRAGIKAATLPLLEVPTYSIPRDEDPMP